MSEYTITAVIPAPPGWTLRTEEAGQVQVFPVIGWAVVQNTQVRKALFAEPLVVFGSSGDAELPSEAQENGTLGPFYEVLPPTPAGVSRGAGR
jgi:hypothetical protein